MNTNPKHATKREIVPTSWRHRAVNMKAKIIFTKRGLRNVHDLSVKIMQISEGDAVIFAPNIPEMGDNFSLVFDASNSPIMSCWIQKKSRRGIYCHFQQEISNSTLERVIAEYEMKNTLEALWGDEAVAEEEVGRGSPAESSPGPQ